MYSTRRPGGEGWWNFTYVGCVSVDGSCGLLQTFCNEVRSVYVPCPDDPRLWLDDVAHRVRSVNSALFPDDRPEIEPSFDRNQTNVFSFFFLRRNRAAQQTTQHQTHTKKGYARMAYVWCGGLTGKFVGGVPDIGAVSQASHLQRCCCERNTIPIPEDKVLVLTRTNEMNVGRTTFLAALFMNKHFSARR